MGFCRVKCPVGLSTSHPPAPVNTHTYRAFQLAQMVKNLPAMQETRFNPWVMKSLWRREWLPTPVFLPREFHGQRRLGCKESDMIEGLTLSRPKGTRSVMDCWLSAARTTSSLRQSGSTSFCQGQFATERAAGNHCQPTSMTSGGWMSPISKGPLAWLPEHPV